MELPKFKREKIKILGWDMTGVEIDATVVSFLLEEDSSDLSAPDGPKYKRYAWVIAEPSSIEGPHVVFLEETPRPNYFEPCIRVPLIIWTSFNTTYNKPINDHQVPYLEHLIGSKINKLRSTYDYNPLVEGYNNVDSDSSSGPTPPLPWWEKWIRTEKRKRKTRKEKPVYYFRNINEDLAPDDFDEHKRPKAPYLFRTNKLREESNLRGDKIKKSMRDKMEKKFADKDMEKYYRELEEELNDRIIREPEVIFLED